MTKPSGVILDREKSTDRLARAQRLADNGQSDAACLLAWAALEAILRRLLSPNGIDLEDPPTPDLLDRLIAANPQLLTQADIDRLVDEVRPRCHAVIHGYGDELPEGPHVEFLLETTRRFNESD